jgi:4-hydroxy-L-threonine phosphate dehydrogenase PdxA
MKPRIALLLGDPGGIGPEIVARLLSDASTRAKAAVLLIADSTEVQEGMRLAGTTFPFLIATDSAQINLSGDSVVLWNYRGAATGPFARASVSAVNGRYCIDTLTRAAEATMNGVTDALCFAPLNKAALHEAGIGHPDEAQWFAEVMSATGTVGELNVLDGLWTSRVTSHVPLKDVAALITPDRILSAIDLVVRSLAAAGVPNPRVAVCGINPHNGDNGTFGREEIDVIAPALEVARARGVNIVGLYPADTIFLRAKEVDAIVTMYHDQGQIAMKLMGFSRGLTVHGGLPAPVVTPAHGTAFDIYGKGLATVGAMQAAFDMACRMATERVRR